MISKPSITVRMPVTRRLGRTVMAGSHAFQACSGMQGGPMEGNIRFAGREHSLAEIQNSRAPLRPMPAENAKPCSDCSGCFSQFLLPVSDFASRCETQSQHEYAPDKVNYLEGDWVLPQNNIETNPQNKQNALRQPPSLILNDRSRPGSDRLPIPKVANR